ncbi:MAG: hypothetical protein Kow0099_11260 [Candidatus Abyssubacteria bacterium]
MCIQTLKILLKVFPPHKLLIAPNKERHAVAMEFIGRDKHHAEWQIEKIRDIHSI